MACSKQGPVHLPPGARPNAWFVSTSPCPVFTGMFVLHTTAGNKQAGRVEAQVEGATALVETYAQVVGRGWGGERQEG